MKSSVNASMFPHHCAHTHKCHTIFFGIMLRSYFTTLRNSITLTLYNISFEITTKNNHKLRFQELEALDEKRLQTQQRKELN